MGLRGAHSFAVPFFAPSPPVAPIGLHTASPSSGLCPPPGHAPTCVSVSSCPPDIVLSLKFHAIGNAETARLPTPCLLCWRPTWRSLSCHLSWIGSFIHPAGPCAWPPLFPHQALQQQTSDPLIQLSLRYQGRLPLPVPSHRHAAAPSQAAPCHAAPVPRLSPLAGGAQQHTHTRLQASMVFSPSL